MKRKVRFDAETRLDTAQKFGIPLKDPNQSLDGAADVSQPLSPVDGEGEWVLEVFCGGNLD